jgi:hypothetical protein
MSEKLTKGSDIMGHLGIRESYRRVILFTAVFKIGSSVSSLMPVKIWISLNSVKIVDKSSSKPT